MIHKGLLVFIFFTVLFPLTRSLGSGDGEKRHVRIIFPEEEIREVSEEQGAIDFALHESLDYVVELSLQMSPENQTAIDEIVEELRDQIVSAETDEERVAIANDIADFEEAVAGTVAAAY